VIEGAIHNLGHWGPAVHVALFALGTVLFVPGALFGLAGGALFGPVRGTILNFSGATVGMAIAFDKIVAAVRWCCAMQYIQRDNIVFW
jgi:uncharacterized membrane protein YdjX (TVP38/TMEM64 family)